MKDFETFSTRLFRSGKRIGLGLREPVGQIER